MRYRSFVSTDIQREPYKLEAPKHAIPILTSVSCEAGLPDRMRAAKLKPLFNGPMDVVYEVRGLGFRNALH